MDKQRVEDKISKLEKYGKKLKDEVEKMDKEYQEVNQKNFDKALRTIKDCEDFSQSSNKPNVKRNQEILKVE